jgi:hypothetical protein
MARQSGLLVSDRGNRDHTLIALREPRPRLEVRLDGAAAALEFPRTEVWHASDARAKAVHKDMHPGVYKAAVISWAVFMGVFWLTFWMSANALFMVAISTAYAAMFFGVPYVMSRMNPDANASDCGLVHFLRGKVDTLYGPINSFEALIQVILVPAALTLGGACMAFAIHAARAAY